MFKEYRLKGMIRSYNWDDYFIYSEKPLFSHMNLTFETVQKFASYAYRRAVLTNPSFILRRFWRGIKTREFFWDAYYFMKFITAPSINNQTHSAIYFAKDEWPVYDFENQPIIFFPSRPATNKLTPDLIQGVPI
ncbi:MAG: hypothetical protein ACD_46C00630G0001 [uncultured bacterium]|nr:MAG: hypothetical protein ACD_46C00630G0001 [uncultured bacterium]